LDNEHVKSMVRGGLSCILWQHNPHTPYSAYYHCCTPEGNRVELNTPFQFVSYQTVYIRHYSTKTVGEWVRNKMRRGYPDQPEEMWRRWLNLDRFFHYNKRTAEKVSYAELLMNDNGNGKQTMGRRME